MEKRTLTLENITKGLVAAGRIKDMIGSNLREDEGTAIKQDRLTTVHETLQLISEFLPDVRGGQFTDALQKSSSYSKAYREIKGHVRDNRNTGLDFNKLAKTIKVVAPILDNKQKVYFEKIAKIVDILNS